MLPVEDIVRKKVLKEKVVKEEKLMFSEKQLSKNRDQEIKRIERRKGIVRLYFTSNEKWNKNYDKIKWGKKIKR